MSGVPKSVLDDVIQRLDARYRAPLMSFFMRRVRSHVEAEDLTQEVFLRVVRHPDLETLEIADSYIFTVAANLLRDRGRRAMARHANAHIAIGPGEEPDFGDAFAEACGPERVLLSREALARVLKALDELGPRTRDIFLLYRFEGMKQRDIAQMFGISPSAVEKQVVKAMARLVNELNLDG